MSIRSKTIMAVAATLIMLVGVLIFAVGGVLLSGFRNVERSDTQRHVQRVVETVAAEVDGIENTALTNAQWDDAYKYVTTKDPTFISRNFSGTSQFVAMKINCMLWVDKSGTILYAGGYDSNKNKAMPVPASLVKALSGDAVLLKNTKLGKSDKGVIVIDGQPLLLVVTPVTNTTGEAPAGGHLVFGKFLDTAETAKISQITHLSVAFTPSQSSTAGIKIAPKDSQIIRGSTILKDVYGKPAVLANVDIPRKIYEQGLKSLELMLAAVLAVAILFGAAITAILDKIVVRRIMRLDTEVATITNAMDFGNQVYSEGTDEISSLAGSVNGLLAAVSEVMAAINQEAA